jgi:hypothetical protein
LLHSRAGYHETLIMCARADTAPSCSGFTNGSNRLNNRRMPELTRRSEERRQQKITLGEMRASGVRGLLIYCADYKCAHAVRLTADRWPDHIRLSQVCGTKHADVRPDFDWDRKRPDAR